MRNVSAAGVCRVLRKFDSACWPISRAHQLQYAARRGRRHIGYWHAGYSPPTLSLRMRCARHAALTALVAPAFRNFRDSLAPSNRDGLSDSRVHRAALSIQARPGCNVHLPPRPKLFAATTSPCLRCLPPSGQYPLLPSLSVTVLPTVQVAESLTVPA